MFWKHLNKFDVICRLNTKYMIPINGKARNYSEYMQWTKELVDEKKTSGHKQTEELVDFTALNLKRMERLDKTIELNKELKEKLAELPEKQTWYVLGEVWCGDSAQNVPLLGKMAEASNGKVDLYFIGRDDNPEWMDSHSTMGTRSIPKLIAFNEKGEELFNWGPRPAPAQEILYKWKAEPRGRSKDDFETELHTWYAKDRTQTLQKEFVELL